MIPFPKKVSEFEVQAQLYQELIIRGFCVRGEVKHEKSRFDLVIYNKDEEAICIIEVKNYKRNKKPNVKTKQIRKYLQYDLPVLVCVHSEQVKMTIAMIKRLI